MEGTNTVFLTSPIEIVSNPSEEIVGKATANIKQLTIPTADLKQPDLLYTRSILVSTFDNQNGAYFIPSELVKARSTIVNKAMDMHHDTQKVVGHIIDYAFYKHSGEAFDAVEAASKTSSDIFDKEPFDIGILSVVYRTRFPEEAKDIVAGAYKVSMETFYKDFDVMVGGVVIPKEDAIRAGLIELIGKNVKVMSGKNPIFDNSTKVFKRLLGIHFIGCGFVENPANERSVILEAASMNIDNAESVNVVDVKNVEAFRKFVQENDRIVLESRQDIASIDAPSNGKNYEGLCVSYKRYLHEGDPTTNVDAKIIREDYCNLFDDDCPVGGSATDTACLRNVLSSTVAYLIRNAWEKLDFDRMQFLLQSGPPPSPQEIIDSMNKAYAPGMEFDIEMVKKAINDAFTVRLGEPIDVVRPADKKAFDVVVSSLNVSIEKANSVMDTVCKKSKVSK